MTYAYGHWRDAFAAVMDPALYTIEWLDRRIEDGSAMCVGNETAAIVFEFREYPTGARDLHGLLAAGSLEEILGSLIPWAEHFARKSGAIGAIIESRPGWMKALEGRGYAPYQTAIRKVL